MDRNRRLSSSRSNGTHPHQSEEKANAGRRACAHDCHRLHGAAIYINIAEQTARLQLDNRSVLAEWKPAYWRGYIMRASLAIVGGLFGLIAYLSTLDWRWPLGVVVLLANWPYTIFMIMPTNRRLMNTPPEAATAETPRMLERRGALHAGRSALDLVATLIFLWAQR